MPRIYWVERWHGLCYSGMTPALASTAWISTWCWAARGWTSLTGTVRPLREKGSWRGYRYTELAQHSSYGDDRHLLVRLPSWILPVTGIAYIGGRGRRKSSYVSPMALPDSWSFCSVSWHSVWCLAVLWIRISNFLVGWIRFGIENADPDPGG